jgi:hypothetical protein
MKYPFILHYRSSTYIQLTRRHPEGTGIGVFVAGYTTRLLSNACTAIWHAYAVISTSDSSVTHLY